MKSKKEDKITHKNHAWRPLPGVPTNVRHSPRKRLSLSTSPGMGRAGSRGCRGCGMCSCTRSLLQGGRCNYAFWCPRLLNHTLFKKNPHRLIERSSFKSFSAQSWDRTVPFLGNVWLFFLACFHPPFLRGNCLCHLLSRQTSSLHFQFSLILKSKIINDWSSGNWWLSPTIHSFLYHRKEKGKLLIKGTGNHIQ